MSYMIPPGLYAVGGPDDKAPVIVTANYKLTFDLVRRELAGRDVWLLVLETFGINVWCAAGKRSFGTEELVARIGTTHLDRVVTHRRLLLPVLGAPGVAAHKVTQRTGFQVTYATLRASDLPEFLDNGQVTTQKMRELRFSLYDRMVLIPVEVVLCLKVMAGTGAAVLVAALALGVSGSPLTPVVGFLGALLTGLVVGPLFLPWLPGRSFAGKGAIVGFLFAVGFYLAAGGGEWNWPVTAASFLAFPAVSSFYTLNFTGCSTYTSRSGVKKEMRRALPVMAGALLVSLVLVVGGRFF